MVELIMGTGYENKRSWTAALSAAVVMSAVLAGCVREDMIVKPESGPSDSEGVDLVCYIDVDEMISSIKLNTKAGDRDPAMNADIDNLSSLAFFVIEEAGPIVAYRIIAPADAGGDQFYLDKDPRVTGGTGINPEDVLPARTERIAYLEGTSWVKPENTDWELADQAFRNDSFHDDDQHYGCWHDTPTSTGFKLKDDCVGYNGFAKLEGNKLVMANYGGTRYPAYDGWNAADPGKSTKPDGKYDDNYTDPDYSFKDYTTEDWMRKGGAIILTFKYDNPMHGPVEKLKRGNYYLIAFANFRESVSNVVQHSAMTAEEPVFKEGNEYIGTHISHIINHWNPEEGVRLLAPLTDPDHDHDHVPYDFIDGAVSLSGIKIEENGAVSLREGTSENTFIRSNKARIVMTGYQLITLTPGNTNVYSYKVVRTAARVTFRVSNYSAKALTLSDFSLSDNFAQTATFLFHEHDLADKLFRPEWQGAPKVNSSKAIVPFPPLVNEVESTGNSITIAPYTNGHVFFDAMTYESGHGTKPLGYQLTMSYEKEDGSTVSKSLGGKQDVYTVEETLLSANLTNKLDIGESDTFCMKTRHGYVHYVAAEGIFYSDNLRQLDEIYDDPDYQFEIKRTSTTGVTIKSIGAAKYLNVSSSRDDTNANIRLSDNPVDFELRHNDSCTGMGFYKDGGYINGLGNEVTGYKYRLVWGNWNDQGSYHELYQVIHTVEEKDHPIEVFKQEVGVAEELYTLHRNDHLVVDIGVTYNEQTQSLDFEVMPWNKVKNYIEFK